MVWEQYGNSLSVKMAQTQFIDNDRCNNLWNSQKKSSYGNSGKMAQTLVLKINTCTIIYKLCLAMGENFPDTIYRYR